MHLYLYRPYRIGMMRYTQVRDGAQSRSYVSCGFWSLRIDFENLIKFKNEIYTIYYYFIERLKNLFYIL